MTKHITIELRSGQVEIEYTDKLLDKIREAYGLTQDDEVGGDLIRCYLEREIRSALDKLEG